ncbi:MAG TPA: replication-associated recombination protein A [Phycisphaerae bacterium]|nr:replication-associated recombination protein A [Phycisphaerae bacterium]HNU45639.1 replication-associated recombination protein A [Phycisphaerae bacterium]
MDLFDEQRRAKREGAAPLAVRMRPRTLDEFVGQRHFVGPGKLLRRLLEADRLASALFYGPPGTGKTTLGRIIAHRTQAHFTQVNASAVGVKEVRDILADARDRLETTGRRSVLFVDELHRFNRSQQDVLLGDVEEGIVILIGATTENPFFTVRTPLISRSQIFRFEPLSAADVQALLRRAAADVERGLGAWNVVLRDDAVEHWARVSDGDARRALSALEIAVLSQAPKPGVRPEVVIDLAVAAESIQRKALAYDAAGDQHYNTISAFIKSVRASDPDAAVYWLARMLEGGEDPRFIARRLVILAAEDIGLADPQGLVVAQAAADATNFVGPPECQLPLAEATIYLACAPKSNAAAQAVWEAARDVQEQRSVLVPPKLQSTAYAGAKKMGAGEGYQYPHDHPGGIVPGDDLGVDRTYYRPTDRGAEAKLGEALARIRSQLRKPQD